MENIFATFASWDFGGFLRSSTNTLKLWGGYAIVLIGVVMVVIAAYHIGKGLMPGNKGQTNWGLNIALLVVGGAFMTGGFVFLAGIAAGGKKTIMDLGNGGTLLPYLLGW